MRGGSRDETGVEFVAFFASAKCDFCFVVADFAHEGCGFAAADVGRVAGDQVEEKWRVTSGEWRVRQNGEEIAFDESNAVSDRMVVGGGAGGREARALCFGCG